MSDIKEREAKVYMQTGRRLPMTLVRGAGTRVWDDEGKSYLDFIAGIAVNALGHCDEGLAEVIAKQARTLVQVSNIFYTEPQIELAELLTEHSVLDRVFFGNSGAEANEAAFKLARKWGGIHRDGAFEIISTHNSFHGRTMATIAATGTPAYREPFGPPLPGFLFVDYGDVEAIKRATTDNTVAVLLEPVQGEGGVNVPPDGYLRQVREWCDERNMLLILDEIQTGLGRTGKLWAYEHSGVEPDIMTSAKALGGGLPIGCVLAKEHAAVFEPGDHGTTLGGNPLATAAGVHVLHQLLDGGLIDNSRERGEQIERRLSSMEDRFELVSGQRGLGLMRGVEFAEDRAGEIALAAIERGLIANPVRPNVIRFLPPLNVTAEEIDQAMDIIEAVLADLER